MERKRKRSVIRKEGMGKESIHVNRKKGVGKSKRGQEVKRIRVT